MAVVVRLHDLHCQIGHDNFPTVQINNFHGAALSSLMTNGFRFFVYYFHDRVDLDRG